MTSKELYLLREDYLHNNLEYQCVHYSDWNYNILHNIMYLKRPGRTNNHTYNDVIIMCDTETSRKKVNDSRQVSTLPSGLKARENHVVAWTISIRAFHMNIVTLYGHKPSTLVKTMKRIHDEMMGEITLMYFHNLPYDHWFIRRFLFKELGTPEKQLNIKPHYPLFVRFACGLEIRDSLMLAQKKLEKWADDLEVEHKKAVGKWDYSKFRNQEGNEFTPDEIEYIEHDTLAGVECIEKTMQIYKKKIYSLPYTMTGFIRDDVRKIGKEHGAKDLFNKIAPTFDQYIKLTMLFHGGYVHANRFYIDMLIEELVQCYDFCSSYPFCMLAFKYPMEKFHSIPDCKIEDILSASENRAFMFKLIAYKVDLKEHDHVMAALQYSKCVPKTCINPILDNGRIIAADYLEIYLNEIDLEVIAEQYKFEGHMCVEVEAAYKDYLPRWFTDYVFNLFCGKCRLSLTDDNINYMVQKAKINGCYGMCVQKSIKEVITENYETDDITEVYKVLEDDDPKKREKEMRKEYDKYLKKRGNILLYFHGVWVTSYAFRNLHRLNKCVKPEEEGGLLLYNDTDSGYAVNWDENKLKAYNEWCLSCLQANNYGSIEIEGRTFTLGIAEHKPLKDDYSEFKVQGAKRYAGRCLKDNEIHITVAGVPKKGAECLHDDLNTFTKGFVFPGKETGKLQHVYFASDIYVDQDGNETADSIDLLPNDYTLDSTDLFTLEDLLSEEIEVQVYEDQ